MANIVVHILLGNLSRVRLIEGAESEFHHLLDLVRELDERLLYDGAKENERLSTQIIELADKTEDFIDNFFVQRRKLYNRVKALLDPDVKKQINDLSTGIKNIVDLTRPLAVTPLPLPPTQTSFLTLNSLSRQEDIDGYIQGHLINRHDPASVLTSVNLSYNTMPLEMQVCFLYFSIFPQGFDIPVWKLIRLWIGEGLITISDSVSSLLEERAESCLNSLVDRNLVMVLQKSCDGRIKVCRVHDLIHDFCKSMAEKWFSQHVSKDDIARQVTARRLCIQTSALNNFLSAKPVANHVRSFYCFSSRRSQKELSDSKLIYKAFPLIRVLDIEPLNFVYSKKFYQLFHLRYVAVSGDFVDVPEAIVDMSNLQTLILHTTAQISFLEIKANIWKLLHLRHVHTNIPAKLRPSPKSKGKDHCLQTLSVVAPESCSKDVFSKTCNLKKVGIRGNLEDFLETSNGGLQNLEELKYLKHLKLYHEGGVLSRTLHLPQSYYNFLNTLKKLTLCNTRFDWNDTNMLGMLGSLEVLKLKEHAFGGRFWKAGSGHFRQLQVLWIENADLQVWEASERHFPRLRHLILKHCPYLEVVPYELAEVSSLEEIRLENTHKAVDSVRKIERKKLESIKFKLTIFPPDTNVEICVEGDN